MKGLGSKSNNRLQEKLWHKMGTSVNVTVGEGQVNIRDVRGISKARGPCEVRTASTVGRIVYGTKYQLNLLGVLVNGLFSGSFGMTYASENLDFFCGETKGWHVIDRHSTEFRDFTPVLPSDPPRNRDS